MSDRVGVMERGKLAQVGTPQEIYARPANPYVADFVGEANILSGTVSGAADGKVTLSLQGLPSLQGIGRMLNRGDTAQLVVRPEAVRLIRGGAIDDSQGLAGTVTDVMFVGDRWKILVDASEAGILTVTSPNRTTEEGPPLVAGDRVRATWSVDDAWII